MTNPIIRAAMQQGRHGGVWTWAYRWPTLRNRMANAAWEVVYRGVHGSIRHPWWDATHRNFQDTFLTAFRAGLWQELFG